MTPKRVLDFWFQESSPEQWFKRDDAFDVLIRTRFLALHDEVVSGSFDDAWNRTPEGALALVIVLDQFSRNLFRDSATAFAYDAKALAIARDAIKLGFDEQLETDAMKKFLYMPFMHSEDLRVQDEGIRLFEKLNDTMTMDFAVGHRLEIARFGRFPRRNKALGRESTPEELDYLKR